MLQQGDHRFIDEPAVVGVVALRLQIDSRFDEAVDRRLRQWKSHGDIYILHLLRDRVEHRQQQGFVAQHHRILLLLSAGSKSGAHPLGQEAGLRILGRSRDIADFLGESQRVEIALGQFVGEVHQIPFQEFTRLMLVDSLGVEYVIIPVEQGLARLLQYLEQLKLHLVEHIEAHEHILVVGELFGIKLFDDTAVEHPFIGNALLRQIVAEAVVDRTQLIPQRDELLLQHGALFDGEILEKQLDGLLLFLVQEVIFICQFLEVLQVAEQLVGIDPIFVDIIEIANQQFAPKVEIVQRLLTLGGFSKHLVEFAHQPDRVARFQIRQLLKQITDAHGSRRPDGAVGFTSQVFIEEQVGPFVGEDQYSA
ncbi:hypothetical protein EVA_19446 [gut metagenome]|uniref:Uncharacterized protein n=1 Tax=gut metagenome TaxID=749906 RepID=J9FYJ3_9ZZZZ